MCACGPPCGGCSARSDRDPATARVLERRRASSAQVALLNAAGHVVTEIRAPERRSSLLAHHGLVALLLLVLGRRARGLMRGLAGVGLGAHDGRRLRLASDLGARR